jgi:3-hydroxymyristoyl/3-hydroxydecanoyl-(acyl carrier protein) dehydratase
MTEHLGDFSVPDSHPALPGHFPGDPVVPGVLLLDHALRLCEIAGYAPLTMLSSVKFSRLVRPNTVCQVTATRRGSTLLISIASAGEIVTTAKASVP